MPYKLIKLDSGETVKIDHSTVTFADDVFIVVDIMEPTYNHPNGSIVVMSREGERKLRPAQVNCMFIYLP
jgi:uncharacterized NAD(P)/FAD-binding protein YdhS